MRKSKLLLRNSLIAFTFLLLALSPGLHHNPQALAQTAPSPILIPLIQNSGDGTWMGPDGGSVVSLAVDSTDSDPNPDQRTVYAGTLHSGVYRSTNGGRTWQSASQGLGNLFIDSITVDPEVGSTLYAGTHGNGVYKSTDRGTSWFPVNNGIADKSVVYTVVVNPGNHSLVYAGTRIEDTQYIGILYKSSNGGASWERVMEFDDDWVYSVAVDPSAPETVLAAVHARGPRISYEYGRAGTWNDTAAPVLDDFLTGRWIKGRAVAFDPRGWMNRAYFTSWHDGMVSYSADGGESWTITGGSLGTTHVYPNGISVKPDMPDIVYLAAYSSSVGGVLRSDDSGQSFRGAGLTGKTIYSVAALGGGGDTLLAGTFMDGLYRSTNGGASWAYSMSGIHDSRVTGMVFPGNNVVYASTTSGGGIFKSVNGGATWARFVTGLGDDRINGLVQHPTNPNVLFALTQHAGLKRIDLSTGTTWTTVGAPARVAGAVELETAGPLAPPAPPDAVFEGAPLVELEADPASQALLAAGTTAEVTAIAFAPSNASIAYFGTYGDGVYSSVNGGAGWSYAGQPGGIVRSLAVSRSNTKVIYAATNSIGFLRLSTNGGVDWSSLSLPDASLSAYSLLILPEDPASLFVGTSSGVYRFRSNVWTKVGLANLQIYRLGYNPVSPKMFFAGTNRGAYLSTLSSLPSWTLIASKMSEEEVVSLNFDPSTRRDIYLGSNGRGTLKVFLP